MQALDDMTQSEPQPTLTDAERAAISERDAAIRERDTAKAEVTRLRAKIRAIRELDRVERCQPAAAPQPASDLIGEIAELRFQLNKYRAKAAAYGGMVRGCNPALERAGHPVEDRGPDGAVGGIARAVEALVREREEARAEVTKLTAALESSRSVQPATETAAAAANDPVREGEPVASEGPGDGYRWVLATGPDGPGEVHEEEDEYLWCGNWRRVRLSIGQVCWEPGIYRRRITPAEAVPDDAAMRILDEASDIDDWVRRIRESMKVAEMRIRELAPDAAGRRLAERETANKEVNRLRLTEEEREAILLAVEHGENASSLGSLRPIWTLTLRRLLKRTK
jgi:hypothetical protein